MWRSWRVTRQPRTTSPNGDGSPNTSPVTSSSQVPMSRSASALPPSATLAHHVVDIGLRRSQEQVCRIDARRIVAGMAYKHPGRDGSVVKLVGEAMSTNCSHSDSIRTTVEESVAFRVEAASPHPAVVRLGNALPEPSKRVTPGRWLARCLAVSRAVGVQSLQVQLAESASVVLSRTSVDLADTITHCQFQSVVGAGRCRPVSAGRHAYSTARLA